MKMNLMKKKKKKGFTLIELIIVVAIIGILAAIAVPRFGNLTGDAKAKAEIATAKSIGDTTMLLVAKEELITTGTGSYTAGTKFEIVDTASTPGKKITDYLGKVPKTKGDNNFYVIIDGYGNVKVYNEDACADTDLVYPK